MPRFTVRDAERQARIAILRDQAYRQLDWLLSPDGAGLSMRALDQELDKPHFTVYRWRHELTRISSASAKEIAEAYRRFNGPPLATTDPILAD